MSKFIIIIIIYNISFYNISNNFSLFIFKIFHIHYLSINVLYI